MEVEIAVHPCVMQGYRKPSERRVRAESRSWTRGVEKNGVDPELWLGWKNGSGWVCDVAGWWVQVLNLNQSLRRWTVRKRIPALLVFGALVNFALRATALC